MNFRTTSLLVCFLAVRLQAATSVQGANGFTVSVDPKGSYSITFSSPAFRFGGNVGLPLVNLAVRNDSDRMGAFSEISFDYTIDAPRHAAIRAYQNRQAVLFSVQYPAGGANIAPFPTLGIYPNLAHHLTFAGSFAVPSFPGFGSEGPWLYFDSTASAFLISPAANYLTASTTRGPSGEIVPGISTQIATFPAGFSHQTLLVVESGINRAFETWGHALTDLAGKTRPANDSGTILNLLGYWTDNGSRYYYQTEPGMSYPDTLAAVNADFAQQGIALGYLQLDSWFYPKGPLADWFDGADGIYDYSGAASLFTSGLQSFQSSLGLPLVTHARWIDPSSPFRQLFQMSGNVSIDPRYWDRVAGFLANSGAIVYEQDWLGSQAHTDFNLTDPYAFLDGMAAALAARGLSMQYCMATPNDFLQSTRYNNLTTIRVSEDRFDRSRWNELMYTGRLASALGIWPFSDVFMSSEADNLLLATLTAGPLAVGDRIGTLSRDNLLHAVRPDGVIVKPDAPIVPLDQSYINDSMSIDAPLIASTYTDFGGGQRTYYVFAYSRGANVLAGFHPAELGIDTQAYIYDYFSDAGAIAMPGELYSQSLANGRGYYIVAPIGRSGIAMLGDRGQFVTAGKKRIPALADDGAVHVTIAFTAGESSRTIFGYAPVAPAVTVKAGSAGAVNYDTARQRFTIDLMPGADQTASVDITAATFAAATGAAPSGDDPQAPRPGHVPGPDEP